MKTASRFDNFSPYTPIEPFEVLSSRLGRAPQEIVKLDANENPYGPSPSVRDALSNLSFPHIYPDPESRLLRTALASFSGVSEVNLLAGSGADELIDLLLRVIVEPGDRVINCPPTFGMYTFDTQLNAGVVIDIPRLADFSLDLLAIRQAVDIYKPKILFLTTPNNPDGSFPIQKDLDEILSLPILVVIDEAYIEFTEDGGRLGEKLSRIKLPPGRDNLIVLRTFSKWAGLAGLRVGYGSFPFWLMPVLWKAKQPYNVNVAASTAALVSLQDIDYLAANVSRLKTERSRLYQALKRIAFLQPFPSQANFILCKVLQPYKADQLKYTLMQYGILVRYYQTDLLQDYIRISVGKPEQHEILLSALSDLAKG
jgi:histidinol-phosphate aminotransferase